MTSASVQGLLAVGGIQARPHKRTGPGWRMPGLLVWSVSSCCRAHATINNVQDDRSPGSCRDGCFRFGRAAAPDRCLAQLRFGQGTFDFRISADQLKGLCVGRDHAGVPLLDED